jgi:hypothetical protein
MGGGDPGRAGGRGRPGVLLARREVVTQIFLRFFVWARTGRNIRGLFIFKIILAIPVERLKPDPFFNKAILRGVGRCPKPLKTR